MRGWKWLALVLLALLARPAQTSAQTQTSVSGTVTDPSGIPYAGARLQILLVVTGSGSSAHLTPCNNGGGCVIQNPGPVTLDVTGSFTVPLWANASILPAPSTYTFDVTIPGAPTPLGTGPQRFTLTGQTIAGATQNLTAALTALAPALSNITGGGGGSPPAPPGFATQFANGAHSAFATATCNGGVIQVDSITSTTRFDVPCNSYFAGGVPVYDVQSAIYGTGQCDGATDVTTNVTAAANAMNANIATGGAGVLYFSRGAGACKFNGTTAFAGITSSTSKYVLMDNSFLLTGAVELPSSAWTFVGRAGSYEGLGGAQVFAATVTWATTGNFPSLDLGTPEQAFWFQGINFIGDVAGGSPTVSPVHLHDNCTGGPNVPAGCGGGSYITFTQDSFQPATSAQVPLAVDSSNAAVGSWFNVQIDHSSLQAVAGQPYFATFINAGTIWMNTLGVGGAGMLFQNNGISLAGGLNVENVTSENMNAATNADFLTVNDGGGFPEFNFTIRDLNISDPTGSVYVFKAVDVAGGNVKNVDVDDCQDGSCGAGIIDPASSLFVGFRCEGNGSSSAGCSAAVANKANVQSMILLPGDGNGFYSYSKASNPSVAADGGFATDFTPVSSATTLSYAHSWYSVTGTTSITVPHLPLKTNYPPNVWTVFNAGTGTVTLACDSGTINGTSTVALGAKTGAQVTSDGTNCWANTGGGATFTAAGDLTGSSSSQTVSKIQGNVVTLTSPAQTQVLVFNSGGVLVNGYAGVNVDQQTGAYTLACPTDRLGEIEFSLTGLTPVAFNIPQAGSTACLQSSYSFIVRNASTSTASLILTPMSSTFQPEAGTTKNLAPNEAMIVYSDAVSGTGNYHAVRIPVSYGGINRITAGGTYLLSTADRNKLVVMASTTACSVEMPATPPNADWNTRILSVGSTLCTINLNGLNYNGSATAPVLTTGAELTVSTDNANYFGNGGGVAGGVTSVSGDSGGIISNASSTGPVTLTFATQLANAFLGGGCTGGSATPTFRVLCQNDIPNVMTTLGDLPPGGASGVPVRLAGPTTPNGVPQYLVDIPSSGAATAEIWSPAGISGRAVTGTTSTDTIVSTDCNPKRVEYVGSVAVAITLPTATTLGVANCVFRVANKTTGSSTALTITSITWTINGSSTATIAQGQVATLYVDPNSSTNWVTDISEQGLTAGAGLTGTRSATGFSLALTTPVSVANGGTGTATPALVAGTNVTITGSWPNQTINSSGSGSGLPAELFNTTPVTDATTGAQNLQSVASNSGDLNTTNRHVRLVDQGYLSTTTGAQTITITVTGMGGTLCSIAPAATASSSNKAWMLTLDIVITTTGAGSGVAEVQGMFVGGNDISGSNIGCANTSTIGSLTTTGVVTFQTTANWTNAANSITQREMFASYLN